MTPAYARLNVCVFDVIPQKLWRRKLPLKINYERGVAATTDYNCPYRAGI